MVTKLLQEKFTDNINKLFGVNRPDKIAVAVSGGSDSMALLYLTCSWAFLNNIDVTIFSVDHNLRAESKLEIVYIKELSNKLGINFVDLSWVHDGKITSIQERAREARYNLITNHCKKLGISSLLTAHHLDDMLETYIIKKSKKASDLALKPNIT